jgi:polysaccharide biosynthesis protein VpsJ
MFDSNGRDGLNEFQRIGDALERRLQAGGFAGWDPYDALNSKLFNALPLSRLPLVRLVWTQALKRSPFELRRLALIPKTANAVTLALAGEANRRNGDAGAARKLIHRLLAMEVEHGGWGYPFAWQAKAFFVPNGAPNIIATAYAVRELRHWVDRDIPGAREAIIRAAELIARSFIRQAANNGRFIAYVAGSAAMVHNASLWGAFVLATACRITGDPKWMELAADAVAYSVAAQRQDGSWPYGEAAHHQFVDGFHTGYVLEALRLISDAIPAIDARNAVRAGRDFYLANLFEADGTAKYYAHKRDPVDANAAAQAVITLDALGEPPEFGRRVLKRAIEWLWLEERGHFAYQASARGINRMDFPRWTQIWMLLALRLAVSGQAREAA